MSAERSLLAARHARTQLELGQTRDAAWLALWSVELDERSGLGWAMLSRIVLEATEDPLGTIGTRYALSLGLPDPEAALVDRLHRIDRWTRGLLAHESSDAILPLAAFDESDKFTETPRHDAWFESHAAEFESETGCAKAVFRMVAAFADAYEVPPTTEEENPLRVEGWAPNDTYLAWRNADPLDGVEVKPATSESDEDKKNVQLLSDYHIEQEITQLGAQGTFELAKERATLWSTLRPGQVKPLAMLIRVLHAGDWLDDRDEAVTRLIAMDSHDLNALEEARVVLGELELWVEQLQILDRMNALAPGHPVILANRGVARMQIGATADGVADLETALETDPNYGPALANLGLHRMREDEYVAARELLERAVNIAPDQPQVRVYLAACKNNQGDKAGAIEELERALELDDGHEQAKQLLEELTSRSSE